MPLSELPYNPSHTEALFVSPIQPENPLFTIFTVRTITRLIEKITPR